MMIDFSISFLINSILLGAGLAMDAFSVSMADGLSNPHMQKKKSILIPGTFAFYQALMPMTGWVCVHTVVKYFNSIEKFIPWIAFILLGYIGGKMLIEGIKNKESQEKVESLGFGTLMIQGIATSIDALSVGFTIEQYNFATALTASLIISLVTFIICAAGLVIGKKFGNKLSNKAGILGGVILIGIGAEILIKSFIK